MTRKGRWRRTTEVLGAANVIGRLLGLLGCLFLRRGWLWAGHGQYLHSTQRKVKLTRLIDDERSSMLLDLLKTTAVVCPRYDAYACADQAAGHHCAENVCVQ